MAGPRTSVERGHIDVVRVGHRSGLAPEYDTGYGFAMSFGFATAFITAFARIVFATGFASGFATGITRAWSAVGFGFFSEHHHHALPTIMACCRLKSHKNHRACIHI